MFGRSIIYDMEQTRDFDFVQFEHDVLLSLAYAMQDCLGGSVTTVISGAGASQTTSPSMTINIADARIYQRADADATAVGAIPQDTTTIFQQGHYAAGQIALSTAGISAGQSRWSLVEAQFSQADVVRANDPNGGIPPFFNASNPSVPLNGQGGLGDVSPTAREGLCILQVITGVAATTGSEVPPSPTGGWIPLYLIDLTFGQTTITTGNILVSGPSVGTNVPSNYPYKPTLAGLLNSHHSGTTGQAPKVQLTAAAEVQGVLPAANQAAQLAHMNVYQYVGGVQEVSVDGAAFTSTGGGSFTAPASGVALVELDGAGGGPGGSGVSGDDSIPSSGGGGEHVELTLSGLSGSYTITVGAPGTAGTSGGSPTNGSDGGATSFGSLAMANGGLHGIAKVGAGPSAGSGASGTGSGLVGKRVPGGTSSVGTLITSLVLLGSNAGNCNGPSSEGERALSGGAGNGQPPQFPGGGGGAGVGGGTGQNGASGCVVIRY